MIDDLISLTAVGITLTGVSLCLTGAVLTQGTLYKYAPTDRLRSTVTTWRALSVCVAIVVSIVTAMIQLYDMSVLAGARGPLPTYISQTVLALMTSLLLGCSTPLLHAVAARTNPRTAHLIRTTNSNIRTCSIVTAGWTTLVVGICNL